MLVEKKMIFAILKYIKEEKKRTFQKLHSQYDLIKYKLNHLSSKKFSILLSNLKGYRHQNDILCHLGEKGYNEYMLLQQIKVVILISEYFCVLYF